MEPKPPRRAFEEVSLPSPVESVSNQALDHLCQMAADIFGANSAALLVLRLDNISRIIASSGTEPRYRSRAWGDALPTLEEDEEIISLDVSQKPALQTKLSFLGYEKVEFYVRTLVSTQTPGALSLNIVGFSARKKPTKRELTLLDDVKQLILDQFSDVAPMLTNAAAGVTAALTLADAKAETTNATIPAVLLDSSLRILALSPTMATLLGRTSEDLLGRSHDELSLPMSDALGGLYRRAFENPVSPPDVEVVIEHAHGLRQVVRVAIAPFSPIETRDFFLIVTAQEVTEFQARARALDERLPHEKLEAEPSFAFLTETLVERRAIRARKSVHYLTLRSWRAPLRQWQIKALKALKAKVPPSMPTVIAEEMVREVSALVGFGTFNAIVPVPCGHSSENSCLSLEIARALSAKLNIPVVQALGTKPMRGSSHPKENVRRPPLVLKVPINGGVLLVDDVATSGAHIEEATLLLRKHTSSVLSVAWISGDSA